jgi:hypothetical protein
MAARGGWLLASLRVYHAHFDHLQGRANFCRIVVERLRPHEGDYAVTSVEDHSRKALFTHPQFEGLCDHASVSVRLNV